MVCQSSRRISAILLIAACMSLAGCFPYFKSYVYLNGEGVQHKREICGLGPNVAVVYQRSGVEFEVSLEPGGSRPRHDREAYVRFVAAETTTLSIPDPEIEFTFTESSATPLRVRLTGAFGVDGRLVSPLRHRSHAVYRLTLKQTPDSRARGRFRLPTVLVDGEPIESPVLTFEPRGHASILPLNC